MDFNAVNAAAEGYREDMVKFLRDLVKIPGESAEEGNKIARAKAEMEKLGFDKIDIDPQGNLLGYMGSGEKLIAFDGHMDTVGIGEMSNWKFDPYDGYETETEIGGRGTSDQEGGIVSAIYGAKIMKDLGLLSEKYTALVQLLSKKKTVTAYVGSTLSKKTVSVQNLLFQQSQQMVGFIVVNEAEWKLKLMSKAFRVMAQLQNVEIMPFTKWRISYKMFVP